MEPYTKERAMEWLNKHWHTPKSCPICKHNNWAVSESSGIIPRLMQDRTEVGGLVYPLFLVTCGTCGYTLFFNALVAGFVPPTSKQDAPSEEKKES